MHIQRYLTDHKVNGLNDALTVSVCDAPGIGGANHHYKIDGPVIDHAEFQCDIRFQNGPIKEAGPNGISHEALLAVLIDRLRGFQSGKFACRENAIALTKIEEAMLWLHKRTQSRLAQGIEGTSETRLVSSKAAPPEVQRPEDYSGVAIKLTEDAVEAFIATLRPKCSSDEHFTLIAGNIRNFAAYLRLAVVQV